MNELYFINGTEILINDKSEMSVSVIAEMINLKAS